MSDRLLASAREIDHGIAEERTHRWWLRIPSSQGTVERRSARHSRQTAARTTEIWRQAIGGARRDDPGRNSTGIRRPSRWDRRNHYRWLLSRKRIRRELG